MTDALLLAWCVLQHADRRTYGDAYGCDPYSFGEGCCLASYKGDCVEVTLARKVLAPVLFPERGLTGDEPWNLGQPRLLWTPTPGC